jgi:hypothetical protein
MLVPVGFQVRPAKADIFRGFESLRDKSQRSVAGAAWMEEMTSAEPASKPCFSKVSELPGRNQTGKRNECEGSLETPNPMAEPL